MDPRSRRVLRVDGHIQAAFAGFSFARSGLTVFGHGMRASADVAPRPRGFEAARIERALGVAASAGPA